MFFGEKFAKEGNRDQIRDAGFKLDELLDGYLLEVSDELGDIDRDFEYFFRRRAILRSLYWTGQDFVDISEP